jgi:3-hydroxyisobutyrate dehydrogenase/2-hydroxy-3-oxopropionate reductase
MKLGFIGLGKMGRPMTINLLKAGFPVVVHNRSRAVVDELAAQGALPANSAAEVGERADLVMTCLPTAETVEATYFGADGLLAVARSGQILIDHSTVSPKQSRRCEAGARARGAAFLDAPVSGGPAGATAATLTIMIGGESETVERARPVLAALGQNVHLVGPSGAGSVIKLTNQLLVAIHTAASAEATLFAVKAGADPQMVKDVIGTSFGGSAMLNRNIPLFLDRKFDGGTPTNLLLKDLGLIGDFCKELNLRTLMMSQAAQIFAEGRVAGVGDQDMSGLIQVLERLHGVEVKRP